MRRLLIASSFAALIFGAASARADEFNAAVQGKSLDISGFNTINSNTPQLRLDGVYGLTSHLNASGYLFMGFNHPLQGKGTELGGEISTFSNFKDTIVTLAGGRLSDYAGQGLRHGDFYAKLQVDRGNLRVAASVLRGDSNTVLFRGDYRLPLTNRLSVSPSIVFLTATKDLNLGGVVSYSISKRLSVEFLGVSPRDSFGHRSAAFTFRISGHF